MITGIFTAVLLAMFLGIVVWAWSGRRRADFAAAAQLPFADGGAGNHSEPQA
ncbi:MAG: CcoQ/FixQ family Cbb3-type cytochrome c oxidase assembly chaperone [Proteobacteria bacterium]|uniref:CcoQ/FixQ family Cbb3-type cytochrome c oxidase assembly chaperone n=1 Tax=Rudaea sp. TaxID=2136325 RepID=UPI0037849B5A|nr:CcoQ/FixQ family Cbb3-type cytochrome c oxidase assembly chaperone [Pseudomonadota bacterium]